VYNLCEAQRQLVEVPQLLRSERARRSDTHVRHTDAQSRPFERDRWRLGFNRTLMELRQALQIGVT
jgi:hypothetical protein